MERTWKTQLIRMLAPRTLLLLGLAAPAAAFGVSARGLSPAKASVRSPAPQLVLGRVKSFVSNRIVSPFKKGSEEEDGEPSKEEGAALRCALVEGKRSAVEAELDPSRS